MDLNMVQWWCIGHWRNLIGQERWLYNLTSRVNRRLYLKGRGWRHRHLAVWDSSSGNSDHCLCDVHPTDMGSTGDSTTTGARVWQILGWGWGWDWDCLWNGIGDVPHKNTDLVQWLSIKTQNRQWLSKTTCLKWWRHITSNSVTDVVSGRSVTM